MLGGADQVKGVLAPGVLLTRVRFKKSKVPAPDKGVTPSPEKAEMRSLLMGPPPDSMLPETFQLFPVSPADEIGGF